MITFQDICKNKDFTTVVDQEILLESPQMRFNEAFLNIATLEKIFRKLLAWLKPNNSGKNFNKYRNWEEAYEDYQLFKDNIHIASNNKSNIETFKRLFKPLQDDDDDTKINANDYQGFVNNIEKYISIYKLDLDQVFHENAFINLQTVIETIETQKSTIQHQQDQIGRLETQLSSAEKMLETKVGDLEQATQEINKIAASLEAQEKITDAREDEIRNTEKVGSDAMERYIGIISQQKARIDLLRQTLHDSQAKLQKYKDSSWSGLAQRAFKSTVKKLVPSFTNKLYPAKTDPILGGRNMIKRRSGAKTLKKKKSQKNKYHRIKSQ